MTLILTCGVCGGYARLIVAGRVCPDHVHIRLDDPSLVAWINSHLMPNVEVLL